MKVNYEDFSTNKPAAQTAKKTKAAAKYFDENGLEIKKTKKTQDQIMAYQEGDLFYVKTNCQRNLVKPGDTDFRLEAEKLAKLAGVQTYQNLSIPHAGFHTYVRYLQDRNNLFYVQAQRHLLAQESNVKGSTVFTETDSLLTTFEMSKTRDNNSKKNG